jgi:threonine synthase
MAPLVFGCPACARASRLSVLEVGYRRAARPDPPSARRGPAVLRRYADLLPGADPKDRICLGEGGTPLIRSRVIGPRLGIPALYFKNETVNPTWSFKDRYVAVTVNVARSLGFRRAIVSSTGNLGVSAAAYCAAAGMDCLFLAPPETARPILDQARLHGAHVLVTTWEGRQPIFERLARERGWFPIGLFLPRPVHNPFGIEGYKTFAYEMLEELGAPPAAMLFPCARGNGLYGAWKGFRETVEFGWAGRTPAMVGCQPAGANSLEASLQRGAAEAVELPPVESVAVSTKETVSDTRALQAIRASGGTALSATEAEILAAVQDLGREGLCVEASSALPLACLPRLLARVGPGVAGPIVCVLTAAGIKWPEAMAAGGPAYPLVDPAPEAVDRYLASLGMA